VAQSVTLCCRIVGARRLRWLWRWNDRIDYWLFFAVVPDDDDVSRHNDFSPWNDHSAHHDDPRSADRLTGNRG